MPYTKFRVIDMRPPSESQPENPNREDEWGYYQDGEGNVLPLQQDPGPQGHQPRMVHSPDLAPPYAPAEDKAAHLWVSQHNPQTTGDKYTLISIHPGLVGPLPEHNVEVRLTPTNNVELTINGTPFHADSVTIKEHVAPGSF